MHRAGRASARHRAEHLATRAVGAVARALPEVAADRLGAVLGWLLARVWRPRWKVVTAQLRTAFPEADERWRLRVARRSYAHFGAEMVAWLRLGGASRAAIRERTRLIGGELLAEARARGRGVMLVSGHLGNWEVGTAGIVARGFAVDVVVARQRNPLFDSYLTGARERLGMKVVLREDARVGVADALEAGRFVGIMGTRMRGARGSLSTSAGDRPPQPVDRPSWRCGRGRCSRPSTRCGGQGGGRATMSTSPRCAGTLLPRVVVGAHEWLRSPRR